MHDCCICGCACYCHGDIDDCPVEHPSYSYMMCEGCGCEEYNYERDAPRDGFAEGFESAQNDNDRSENDEPSGN